MNVDKLKEVQAAIITEASRFNMDHFLVVHNHTKGWCGTSGCIAGHAIMLNQAAENVIHYSNEFEDWEVKINVFTSAREILGLNVSTADDLFMGLGANCPLENITPSMAAKAIQNIIETGEPMWFAIDYDGE